ncbi:ATP-grasp domain-containing protein [Hyphomonas sp.]|uniref:ATP-grasp domain-containing protein n=1 Tax=Hyphomonas sp. TaxID=87 RepID=UPI0025B7BE28|nr:ATP-grasp domain-containing protein [Hyphomonas sp.]MBI1400626.1 ATP-grasp domain-containing protein [Hyphomonas sp.]
MHKTVLLTLGRLPKALELARALHGEGARVIVAEPFGAHVCRASRAVDRSFRVPSPNADSAGYLAALESIVRDEDVDIVVPVSEEALHATALAGRLPARTRLFAPPKAQLERLHDKLVFNRLAAALELPVPETHEGHTPAANALAAAMDYIVKPAHGCSGIGVALRRRGDWLQPEDRIPGMLVQARLPGRHISSFTIAREGEILATVLYQGRIYSGTVSVAFERVDNCPAADEWIRHFVAREAYTGFISFDFIEDADGVPAAIECNPRLTSGVHFVDPTGLADCVLNPSAAARIGLKKTRAFQEGHTALLEVYGAAFRPRECVRRLKALLTSEDVLFRLNDPGPFFLFTLMSWPVLRQAMFEKVSLGEAATRDIVWHPGADAQIALSGSEVIPTAAAHDT